MYMITWGVYNQWTGNWTGMDYWTDAFLVSFFGGLINSHWLQGICNPS